MLVACYLTVAIAGFSCGWFLAREKDTTGQGVDVRRLQAMERHYSSRIPRR